MENSKFSIDQVVFLEIEINSMSHYVPVKIAEVKLKESKIVFENEFEKESWHDNKDLFSHEELLVRVSKLNFN